jgi:hypothetical protein
MENVVEDKEMLPVQSVTTPVNPMSIVEQKKEPVVELGDVPSFQPFAP